MIEEDDWKFQARKILIEVVMKEIDISKEPIRAYSEAFYNNGYKILSTDAIVYSGCKNAKKLSNAIPNHLKLSGEEAQKLTVKQFFRLIKKGVENILGVKLNYRELSKDYLTSDNKNGGNKWYINDLILDSLRFTDFALHTTSLNRFKRNLIERFKENSAYFEYIIDLYKSMHPYKKVRHNVNSNYFKNIDILEKAYWFGLLLAEAHIQIKNNIFSLSLSPLDAILLKKFWRVIGFDFRRIKFRRRVEKSGITTSMLRIDFANKQFCDNLKKNGFPENDKTSRNREIRFPFWLFKDKRFVMAMLLGFFDGDGSHGLKHANMRNSEDKNLSPLIEIKTRLFLEDIKEYFGVKNDIKPTKKGFELRIGTKLFNTLLDNYKFSLERKRYTYPGKDSRFKLTKEELKKLYSKAWSSYKIAKYHLIKFGIKIAHTTVQSYANEWGIKKASLSEANRKITIELLMEHWDLETIYTKELGYTYNPAKAEDRYRLKNDFKKWFANDRKVKDNNGKVVLQKIVEVYGDIDKNSLIWTKSESQKMKVIEARREKGLSCERIYTEIIGYNFDPSNRVDRYNMRQKFKEMFMNDPAIEKSENIIDSIETVYNPSNRL